MLDLTKKTNVLALLMAAGYNRTMAERFVQPSNIAYQCTIWKKEDWDFLTTIHGFTVEDIKAGKHPGFEYVKYEKDEEYILEVSY